MTHSKNPFPSCRLIRSPGNLARRKNNHFYSVPRSSWKLPGSSPGSFPKKRRKQNANCISKVDMTAAPEAPGNFLGVPWKFYEQKRTMLFVRVRCVEHGERECATIALEDFWE